MTHNASGLQRKQPESLLRRRRKKASIPNDFDSTGAGSQDAKFSTTPPPPRCFQSRLPRETVLRWKVALSLPSHSNKYKWTVRLTHTELSEDRDQVGDRADPALPPRAFSLHQGWGRGVRLLTMLIPGARPSSTEPESQEVGPVSVCVKKSSSGGFSEHRSLRSTLLGHRANPAFPELLVHHWRLTRERAQDLPECVRTAQL